MSKEKFYDDNGDFIDAEYDLWDFDEETQKRIKRAMRETGFDKWIDMDKAFIPREEEDIEVIDLQDLLGIPTSVNTNYDKYDKKLFKAQALNKMELSKTTKIELLNKTESPETAKLNDFVNNKVNFADKIEHIHLSKLESIDDSVNFFPLPDDEEFLDLMENIENFGILSPLLVIRNGNDDEYAVVCGRSRLAALNHLFNETQDEKYLHAPCLILDSSTDLDLIQSIVISTNFNYRKISKETQIKAVLLLDKILTNSKTYRTQMNVTDVVADRAGISRTTANTIRGFKNLSPKALDLLYKNHITRGAARILSMIEGHETQDMIIDKVGNQINDIPKLREILAGPGKKVYDRETKTMMPDSWERKIENTLDKVPRTTTITLQVDCKEVEEVLKALIPLRGRAVSKFQTYKDGEINKYFKVTLNDNHMEQYLRKGFVTKETIDLVRSGDYKEVIKYA